MLKPKTTFSMKFLLLVFGLFFQTISFSQFQKAPVELTPQLQEKIKQKIEKDIPKLKQQFEKEKENAVEIEFTLDTFRVEQFMSKWIELDYGDFGMRDAGYEGARIYDSLLNKYYKKLLAVLKADDKKNLIQAQKSWLAFRDSETNLVETISKDEYAGGGTMQQLTESSEYLDLVKTRTITIFNHFTRATHN